MRLFLTFILLSFVLGCSGNPEPNNEGYFSLKFVEKDDFNATASPGVIDNFKITVTCSDRGTPIIQYYSADTEEVQFDGFADGVVVTITVEAINQNGFVIRRGYSEPITIVKNETAQSTVEIFNVPIFTNINPDSYVNVDRFVPKVFAPGEINFQLSDTVGDVSLSLTDSLSGELTLSISDDEYPDSTMPVYIATLAEGPHTLRVEDPDTHEATDINVTGYHSLSRKVLMTTAGGYLGVAGSPSAFGSNAVLYFQHLVGDL